MRSLLVFPSLHVIATRFHVFLILVEVLLEELGQQTVLLTMTGAKLLSFRELVILQVSFNCLVKLLLFYQKKDKLLVHPGVLLHFS